MNKAYKFRIYPNEVQKQYFENCFTANNFIYNYFLGEQIYLDNMLKMYDLTIRQERNRYKTDNSLWYNKYSADKTIRELCNNVADKNDYNELNNFDKALINIKECDSTIIDTTVNKLDKAFQNIRTIGAGFPNFKKRTNKKSFTGRIRYGKDLKPSAFKIIENKNKWCIINIPKLKELKCVIHSEDFIQNWNDKKLLQINSYTVSSTPKGDYYVSFQIDNHKVKLEKKEINKETSLGIDMGVVRPITTSDENDFNIDIYSERFDLIKEEKEEIKRLSQILSKKRINNPNWKTSNKYKRIKKRLASLHNKIANQRENIQHNITKKLVNKENINTFILEDLKIKNMTKKSAKGKSNNKRHLSKAILDVGWFGIATKLTYKAEELGKNVEKINPSYTSQKCSNCGHINKLSRINQSLYICTKCNVEQNADFNAANNIKNKFFNIV